MYSFEHKEVGQNPNSESTDSHGIAAEVAVVEAGIEQEVEVEVQMMAAVAEEGMAGKKPYPKFSIYLTISPNKPE